MPIEYLSILLIFILAVFFFFYSRKIGFSGESKTKGSILTLYSKDLTKMAAENKIDPVIGRHQEIKRLIQILTRRTKNNPVLIGKPGVGKTAIVEELAAEINSGRVPETLKGKKVLSLDLSGMVAGTKYRGEFEQRLKSLTDEIIAAERNIILFIDELQTLAEAGGASGAINAADILKPALARGELQAVGASTPEEYMQYVAHDKTLERRFQPIYVEEPNIKATIKILEGLKNKYEQHHGVKISSKAIEVAVKLAKNKIIDRFFPDKAIDLIDEASAMVRLEKINNPNVFKNKLPEVLPRHVEEIIKEWADHSDELYIEKKVSSKRKK